MLVYIEGPILIWMVTQIKVFQIKEHDWGKVYKSDSNVELNNKSVDLRTFRSNEEN